MKRIINIGMDVHSTNYTLCALDSSELNDRILGSIVTVQPDVKNIFKFIDKLKSKFDKNDELVFRTAYEAGCLGYSLYNQLTDAHIECVIMAPTTMMIERGIRQNTEKKDAEVIAKCLAYNTYKPVYVLTKDDAEVKEYIRMRDDHALAIKKIKHQILSLCLRHGVKYEKTYWTQVHVSYLKVLELTPGTKYTLNEYLHTYDWLTDKLKALDLKILNFTEQERYAANVKKLICFKGIKQHTALALLSEVGDFSRFESADKFMSAMGLVPLQNSSGDKVNINGISKAGNGHLRRLLVEASNTYSKGTLAKSRVIKARQESSTQEVIAYADKGSERLKRKYNKLMARGVNKNKVVTAVARELAGFIWGMMTENYSRKVNVNLDPLAI